MPDVVTHTFVPALEVEADRSPRVQSQPGLHNELQDSQGYIVRLCLKIMIINKQINKNKNSPSGLASLGDISDNRPGVGRQGG